MKNIKKLYFIVFTVILFSSCKTNVQKTFTEHDINIIPKPVETSLKKGTFEITNNTKIVLSDNNQKPVAEIFAGKFKKAAGWTPEITGKENYENNVIEFIPDDSLLKDAYYLSVGAQKIIIKAGSYGGFLYGIETLLQLLPDEIEGENMSTDTHWILPQIEIKDQPRFSWRGLMLDLSRHFFGKEYIKKTIDRLAMHKMNVLHLHLVDDQGWRIEIKKYPKLTKVGAWRVDQEDKHWNNRAKTNPE